MKFREFRDISGISGDFNGYFEIGRIFCRILDICLFRYRSLQNTDISVDISVYLSILSTLLNRRCVSIGGDASKRSDFFMNGQDIGNISYFKSGPLKLGKLCLQSRQASRKRCWCTSGM